MPDRVIILAAGEGTRLRPYTQDTPKCMVPVLGRPLLNRQIEVLRSRGITDLTVVAGYKSERIEGLGIPLLLNPNFATTNMVSTLFCAREQLTDGAIVSYGDIVYSQAAVDKLLAATEDFSVIVDLDWRSYWQARFENPLDDAETLRIDNDGHILEIGNKPKTLDEIQGQYIGLMKFSPKAVKHISALYDLAHEGKATLNGKSHNRAYMTDLLAELIARGHAVKAITINGGWVEVDSVLDLQNPITKTRIQQIQDDSED